MKFSSSIVAVAGATCLFNAFNHAGVLDSFHLSRQTAQARMETASPAPEGDRVIFAVPPDTILFQDNFDTDTSANWNVFAGSSSGTEDYTIDWAFDYSTNRIDASATNTIPLAPNSNGTSLGVKMTVNHNDDVAETAAVNIYPKDQAFSGDYALRFDMWINYNGPAGGGVGSTEHGIFGINHIGDKVNWHAATASDGLIFGVTGEGGSGAGTGATPTDYTTYEGDPGGSPLRFEDQQGGFLDRNGDGTIEDEVPGNPELNLLFPGPTFETAGAPGKQWVQVEVRQVGTTVTWLMNGYVIAEKTSAFGWTSGNIMLGLMDVFSSIANPPNDTENFIIFDNVRVVDLDGTAARPRLTLAATNPAAAEPGSPGSFTVTRTGDLGSALAVNLRIRGTATAGEDYTAIPLTTNIPAGSATVEIPVTVINDQRAEPTETVNLDLVSGAGYEVFAPMTGTVEIADDNDISAVSVTAHDPYAYEKIAADRGVFRISRVGDNSTDLTVNYTLAGTAQSGTDYQTVANSVVLPAGLDFVDVAIVPIDNATANADRTVELTLGSGTGYVLGTATNGLVTVRNDDDGVELGELLFSDDFDTDTSAEWTVNEAHVDSNRATFNFNYADMGIPIAPDTTNATTRGLKLEANIGAPTFTGLSVSPTGEEFSGDYRLSFDMWINFNGPLALGGSGSTLSLSAGVGTSGTVAQFPASSVEGVMFSVTGDGGSGSDWRAYASTGAPLTGDTGAYAGGTEASVLNNSHVYYAPFGRATAPEGQLALYPDQTEETSVGAPGMAWHEVVIEKRGTNFTWIVDNLPIATITLTNKEIGSNIFVGFFDINMGQTGNQDLSFGLIDNLRVHALEAAEPPVGEIQIGGIARSGNNIQVTFTAPDAMQSFVVEGSETVDGDYSPEANVQFETVSSAGGVTTRRATLPMSTVSRFFVVRQQ